MDTGAGAESSPAPTNAAKHANASTVTVETGPARAVLVGIKDRVEALPGRVLVDSPRGAGTRLDAELPLSAVSGSVTSR